MDGMDAANPYAAPTTPLTDGVTAADADAREEDGLPIWRLEGRTLIARNGATLPDICLLTGEATTPRQRVRLPFFWTPVWFRCVLLFAPIYGLFALNFYRRASTLEVGLGRAGRRRLRLVALLALGASVSALALIHLMTSRARDEGDVALAPLLVVFLVASIVTALIVRVYSLTKVERKYTRVRLRARVAAAFARLPPPPAPPG